MYANVKSLCSTPETNIILFINYISIFKNGVGKTVQKNEYGTFLYTTDRKLKMDKRPNT